MKGWMHAWEIKATVHKPTVNRGHGIIQVWEFFTCFRVCDIHRINNKFTRQNYCSSLHFSALNIHWSHAYPIWSPRGARPANLYGFHGPVLCMNKLKELCSLNVLTFLMNGELNGCFANNECECMSVISSCSVVWHSRPRQITSILFWVRNGA